MSELSFTVVLEDEAGWQYAYQLHYQPCPIWCQGDNWVVNLCDNGPHYKKGSFRRLLEVIEKRGIQLRPKCVLVADKTWKASTMETPKALDVIIEDIKNEGFTVTLVKF